MPVTSVRASAPPDAPSGGPVAAATRSQRAPDQLDQLRFLHEVAKLATTARTWDELLETVVDRTRDVLHADVSSLYLLDRDGAYLTLAATNGLDRFQTGRARVPFGDETPTATSAPVFHPPRSIAGAPSSATTVSPSTVRAPYV